MLEIDYRSIPLGAQPSPPDARDWHISRLSPVIPKAFAKSLEIPYPHIKNQGGVGSCVAHALSEFREVIEEKQSGKYIQLSPGFIYGMRKDVDYQGIGMYPRQAMKELVDCGVCSNELLPDNIEYPAIKDLIAPKLDVLIKDAYPHRLSAYASLFSVDDVKTALSNGWPVPITVNIYSSFYNVTKANPIVPKPNMGTESYVGSHEMLITGWREDDTWIVVNSWGEGWGDGGKCYIPFDCGIIIEMWTGTDSILPTPPEPEKIYTLAMTTDKTSYVINELVMFKIHTSEPNQPVSCIFNRPSNIYPFNPEVVTNSNGDFLMPIAEKISGDLKGYVKWVDPNGDTQEVKLVVRIELPEPEPEPTPPKSLYHVQVGAFGVKENADKLAAELKAKGYPVFVVQYSSVNL